MTSMLHHRSDRLKELACLGDAVLESTLSSFTSSGRTASSIHLIGTAFLFKFIGQKPISMYDFVKLHTSEFTRHGTAA
jgi:hypothetical protein